MSPKRNPKKLRVPLGSGNFGFGFLLGQELPGYENWEVVG
jgi:hypothetical protein